MKVRLSPLTKFDEQGKYVLNNNIDQLSRTVNNIEFGGVDASENISCVIKTTTTSTADTEFSITHSLDRIPVGFIVINTDKYCNIKASGTTWTTSLIYLKCDVATVALTLLIF